MSDVQSVELKFLLTTTTVVLFFVVGPTVMLMRSIEKAANRVNGVELSSFQRRMIPAPAVVLVFANFLGALSCRLYAASHSTSLSRYPEHSAFSTDWIFYIFLGGIALLPFYLTRGSLRGARLIPVIWGGHFLWFFPYTLLLLWSGVPFRD